MDAKEALKLRKGLKPEGAAIVISVTEQNKPEPMPTRDRELADILEPVVKKVPEEALKAAYIAVMKEDAMDPKSLAYAAAFKYAYPDDCKVYDDLDYEDTKEKRIMRMNNNEDMD